MYDAVHWLRGISSRERAIMKKQCFFGGMTMPAAQLMLAPPSVLRRFCASHSIIAAFGGLRKVPGFAGQLPDGFDCDRFIDPLCGRK